MTTHEFDAHCDIVAVEEPDYHEQIAMMQEMEECRESALKQQGAIDALQSLTITLSALCLRELVIVTVCPSVNTSISTPLQMISPLDISYFDPRGTFRG